MNEPGRGFIGLDDLSSWPTLLTLGAVPSPAEAILAALYPQEVPLYRRGMLGFELLGTTVINPEGLSVWREGARDVWMDNGVWSDAGGEPRILRPGHFARWNGRPVVFERDFLKPFLLRFIAEIRSVDPDALVFIESSGEDSEPIPWGPNDPPGVVYAPHWYDGYAMFNRRFSPEFTVDTENAIRLVFGASAVQELFNQQLGSLRKRGDAMALPTIIGEFGLPMNMEEGASYRTGDYKMQRDGLHAYFQAMDAALLGYTQWVYTADNTNEHGDLFAAEDFSIWSADQQSDPNDINSGGRALEAVVRPAVRATAGTLRSINYDRISHDFEFSHDPDPDVAAPTEVYVPRLHYGDAYEVEVSGSAHEGDRSAQILRIFTQEDSGTAGSVTVRIRASTEK